MISTVETLACDIVLVGDFEPRTEVHHYNLFFALTESSIYVTKQPKEHGMQSYFTFLRNTFVNVKQNSYQGHIMLFI